MRTNPQWGMLLLACALAFTGCKKGEDDPAFSLRTRKARVVGNWVMSKGTASFTYNKTTEPSINDDFSFDGNNLRLNETEAGSQAIVYVGHYTLLMSFKKDGNFTLTETLGTSIMEAAGTWNFVSGVGDTKNKESIIITLNTVTGASTSNHIFNKAGTEFVYRISELRNKEMTIKAGTKIYFDKDGSKTAYQAQYTLKAD